MNLKLAGRLALLLVSSATAPAAAVAQSLAFTPVTVIDVRDGVARSDMTVVVTGDRITWVGPAGEVAVPAGAVVIDGTGKYLIPGLWDMHAHTSSDSITREILYPLFIAHGVTGIRNLHADCIRTGDGCSRIQSSINHVRAHRQAIAAGELVGPRVVASSAFAESPRGQRASLEDPHGSGDRFGDSSVEAPGTEADARAFVRLAQVRGVDFIKVYDMLSRDAYFALADEANRLGLPFAGHVPVAVRASEAASVGQRSIEHLGGGNVLEECSSREGELRPRVLAELASDQPDLLPLMLEMVDTHDPEKCAALAQRFVRNGTWIVPTLMIARLPAELGEGWRGDPYARFLPPDERRYLEWAEETIALDMGNPEAQTPYSRWVRETTGIMHRAGVRMLAGSDAGVPDVFWGIGLHQELKLLVSAGLTEGEALQAATLGPAEFLGATDSLGTVEAGKVADLVLLDANPLEDISNTQRIASIVVNGRLFDRDALDAMLADAERAARSSSSPIEPGAGE